MPSTLVRERILCPPKVGAARVASPAPVLSSWGKGRRLLGRETVACVLEKETDVRHGRQREKGKVTGGYRRSDVRVATVTLGGCRCPHQRSVLWGCHHLLALRAVVRVVPTMQPAVVGARTSGSAGSEGSGALSWIRPWILGKSRKVMSRSPALYRCRCR
jgi:hypothetical protein